MLFWFSSGTRMAVTFQAGVSLLFFLWKPQCIQYLVPPEVCLRVGIPESDWGFDLSVYDSPSPSAILKTFTDLLCRQLWEDLRCCFFLWFSFKTDANWIFSLLVPTIGKKNLRSCYILHLGWLWKSGLQSERRKVESQLLCSLYETGVAIVQNVKKQH